MTTRAAHLPVALVVLVLTSGLVGGCAAPAGVPSADGTTGSPAVTAAPSAPAPTTAASAVPVRSAAPDSGETPVPVPRQRATPRPATSQGPVPVSLRLPDIGIDARVDPTGVDVDGLMALPDDPDRAGWYRFGAVPGGRSGQAVLAAHVDTIDDGIGQFSRLASSEVGDRVEVRLSDGHRVPYEVVSVDRVERRTLPLNRLFDRRGSARIAVVTCGGQFDRGGGGYRDNVVVVAEPT